MGAQEQDLWADAEEEESDFWTRRAFHAFTVTVIVAASAASVASAGAVVELSRCSVLPGGVVQLRCAKPSECRRLLKVEPVPSASHEQAQPFFALCY
jgi:hypothetical protein